jgi:hypothetical protein
MESEMEKHTHGNKHKESLAAKESTKKLTFWWGKPVAIKNWTLQ